MFEQYRIARIPAREAKEFVKQWHYAHGSHNGPSPCYGLFDEQGALIGVCMFATPCSENVRASVFGPEYKDHVIELHRLVILDGTPRNTESWFIARCLKLLKQDKPHIWAVLSFADPTAGHVGTIYQASNFYYCGRTPEATFYIDQEGRLRHPRQCGRNIYLKEALQRGWKPVKRKGKYRYVKLLPDSKAHGKVLLRLLKLTILPYPKSVENE